MLGFIDHDCDRPTITDSLLYSVAVFGTDCSGCWHEVPGCASDVLLQRSIEFTVNQWFVKLIKETLEMIAPVEAPGLRSHCFDTYHRNPREIFREFAQKLFCNQLLDFQAQRSLANPGRSKHENERIRLGPVNRIHQNFFRFSESRVSNRVGTKIFKSRFRIGQFSTKASRHHNSP